MNIEENEVIEYNIIHHTDNDNESIHTNHNNQIQNESNISISNTFHKSNSISPIKKRQGSSVYENENISINKKFITIGTIGACLMSSNNKINDKTIEITPKIYENQVLGNYNTEYNPFTNNDKIKNTEIINEYENNIDVYNQVNERTIHNINLNNFIYKKNKNNIINEHRNRNRSLNQMLNSNNNTSIKINQKSKKMGKFMMNTSNTNNTYDDSFLLFQSQENRQFQNEHIKRGSFLEYKITKNEEELKSLIEFHKNELIVKEKIYNDNLNQINQNHKAEVENLVKSFELKVADIRKEYEIKIEEMKFECENLKQQNYLLINKEDYINNVEKNYKDQLENVNKEFNCFKKYAKTQLESAFRLKDSAFKQLVLLQNKNYIVDKTGSCNCKHQVIDNIKNNNYSGISKFIEENSEHKHSLSSNGNDKNSSYLLKSFSTNYISNTNSLDNIDKDKDKEKEILNLKSEIINLKYKINEYERREISQKEKIEKLNKIIFNIES